MQHTNTAGQFSTGPHANPSSGIGSNPDFAIVRLTASVSQKSLGVIGVGVPDENDIDGYGSSATPYPTTFFDGSGIAVGPTNLASYTLSHNDESGFLGTGALHLVRWNSYSAIWPAAGAI